MSIPVDTLEDWVTYGDYVIVGTVSGDETFMLETPSDDDEDVSATRLANLSDIDVLYERQSAPELPSPLRPLVEGSSRFKGDWTRTVVSGWPRMEVGNRYLVVVAYRPDFRDVGNGNVRMLSAMPADGDVAGEGEWLGLQDDDAASTAQKALRGLPIEDVRQKLAQTPPDPLAVPYFDLSPDQRWEKVSEQR